MKPEDKRANTEALKRSQDRVRQEYSAAGRLPPSELALSPSTLKAMGIPLPPPAEEPAQ